MKNKIFVDGINLCIIEKNITMVDLQEVEPINNTFLLQDSASLDEAKSWLKVMRGTYTCYNHWPKLKKILRETGISFEDIGTDACEIISLIKTGKERYNALKEYWYLLEMKAQAVRAVPETIY